MTIWLWSKHLKNPTNQFLLGFKCSTPLTNSLFRPSFFSYLMHGQKVFKIIDFWFIDTWDNIDQLQQDGSCIRMICGCIWVGRIRARILLELHKSLSIHTLVSFQKDLSLNPSHSNSTIWHLNTRSTPLSWFILFQVFIN